MTKAADKTAANQAASLLATGRVAGATAELHVVDAGGALLVSDNRVLVRLDDHPELALLAAVPGFYILDKDNRSWRAVASEGRPFDPLPVLRASAESAVDPLSRQAHLQPVRLLADGSLGLGGRQPGGSGALPVLMEMPEALLDHPYRGPLRLFGTSDGRRLAVSDEVLRWVVAPLGVDWTATLALVPAPSGVPVRAMALWTPGGSVGSSDVWRGVVCSAAPIPDAT